MHRLKCFSFAIGGIAIIISNSPQAFAQVNSQPDELQAIYACKTIVNPQDRLACYDSSVGRFEAAERSGEVLTVSKAAIENVEREAFGFNIPSLPSIGKIFGGGSSDKTKKESDLTAPVKQATREIEGAKTQKAPTLTSGPEMSKIEGVTLDIRKTTEFGYKKTRFFMTNGQVWEQSDTARVRIPKKSGGSLNTAEISKAALGSFLLKINGKGAAIRVRRVQ